MDIKIKASPFRDIKVLKTLKLVNFCDTYEYSPVLRYFRDISPSHRKKLTLDWADHQQRHQVIDLIEQMGRQTAHLRSLPEAKLAILRLSNGELVGWAGMHTESKHAHPKLFSHFIYPQYRGLKLGRLLEHVWWAYLTAWGHKIGHLNLEQGNSKRLLNHKITTEYCTHLKEQSKSVRHMNACQNCELQYCDRKGQTYHAIDVKRALASRIRSTGKLDICKFPIRIALPPNELEANTKKVARTKVKAS